MIFIRREAVEQIGVFKGMCVLDVVEHPGIEEQVPNVYCIVFVAGKPRCHHRLHR